MIVTDEMRKADIPHDDKLGRLFDDFIRDCPTMVNMEGITSGSDPWIEFVIINRIRRAFEHGYITALVGEEFKPELET